MIMALAFLGMLFNENKFLNEFGFIMITGQCLTIIHPNKIAFL